MLKIKDDVDLKELEKFGFEEYSIVGKIRYEFIEKIGNHELYNIKIDNKRVIRLNQFSVNNELPSVIYGLIIADMVEKV